MKDTKAEMVGNTCWYCPQVSISVYQKRGKYFSGIKIFHAYKEHTIMAFRLTKILK